MHSVSNDEVNIKIYCCRDPRRLPKLARNKFIQLKKIIQKAAALSCVSIFDNTQLDSRTDTADEDEAACTSRHYSESCVSEYLTALTEDAEGPGGVHKDAQQELEIDFRLTKFLGLLLSII